MPSVLVIDLVMINLDFTLQDEPGAYDDEECTRVLTFADSSTFQGGQKFMVNDETFVSCEADFPVLCFARDLRLVLQWLATTQRAYQLSIPDGGQTFVFGRKDEGSIIIFPYPDKERIQIVSREELAMVLKPYCRRVYRRCESLYKPMRTSEEFKRWLYRDYDPSTHGVFR